MKSESSKIEINDASCPNLADFHSQVVNGGLEQWINNIEPTSSTLSAIRAECYELEKSNQSKESTLDRYLDTIYRILNDIEDDNILDVDFEEDKDMATYADKLDLMYYNVSDLVEVVVN